MKSGDVPPPQVTWTLLGLLHYRARKHWADRTLREHIAADIQRRQGGCVSLQEVLNSRCTGIVPGLPEWSFDLGGNPSFVNNPVTGEQIHLDIANGPEVIGSCYFLENFASIRQPGPAEQRLKKLFPHSKALMVALGHLNDCQVFRLTLPADFGVMEFKLSGRLRKYAGPVEAFLAAWEQPGTRLDLARLIGDWPVVAEAAEAQGDERLTASAKSLAARSRRQWLNLARVAVDTQLWDYGLYALADAGAEDLPEYLAAALANPSRACTAIEIVTEDPRWRKQVYRVLQKSLRRRSFHEVKTDAAFYLAKHGHSAEELIRGLLAEPPDIAAAIELAIDHVPEELPVLLRQAIRSPVIWDRTVGAAVLALLDTRWSRQELLAVLDESSSRDATIECRCALRECHDEPAALAADGWDEEHPDEAFLPVTSDGFMHDMERNCEQGLREKMQELHDRVHQIRGVLVGAP
jgi:hypothetical protein